MQMPKEEEWRAIAEEFEKEWDFPNCLATCILHNLLRSTEARPPSSDEAVPLEGGRRLGTNNSTKEVMQERERFMTYFNSAAGEVSWQNNIV
ncbi:unnamed protein product [Boreogadus saida]